MSYAYEPSPEPSWWKELTKKEQIEWYNGYIKALKDVMVYVSVTEYGFSKYHQKMQEETCQFYQVIMKETRKKNEDSI